MNASLTYYIDDREPHELRVLDERGRYVLLDRYGWPTGSGYRAGEPPADEGVFEASAFWTYLPDPILDLLARRRSRGRVLLHVGGDSRVADLLDSRPKFQTFADYRAFLDAGAGDHEWAVASLSSNPWLGVVDLVFERLSLLDENGGIVVELPHLLACIADERRRLDLLHGEDDEDDKLDLAELRDLLVDHEPRELLAGVGWVVVLNGDVVRVRFHDPLRAEAARVDAVEAIEEKATA